MHSIPGNLASGNSAWLSLFKHERTVVLTFKSRCKFTALIRSPGLVGGDKLQKAQDSNYHNNWLFLMCPIFKMAKKKKKKVVIQLSLHFIKGKTPIQIFQWLNTVQWTDHWQSNATHSMDPGVTPRTKQGGGSSYHGGGFSQQPPALSTPQHKMKCSTLQQVLSNIFPQTDRTVPSWKGRENSTKHPLWGISTQVLRSICKRLNLTAKCRLWLIPNTD